MGAMLSFVHVDGRRHWVAAITGLDSTYQYRREFQRGRKDYRRAKPDGYGIRWWYELRKDTIYEVSYWTDARRCRRFFCRAESGRITEIREEEVTECLSAD